MEETAKLTTGMVSARSDSQIVVMAVEKQFVKNESYKEYLKKILEIANTFDFFFIKWIPDVKTAQQMPLREKLFIKKTEQEIVCSVFFVRLS